MLQRFGIVIAMAGLIPACFTNGDKKTAHKHLGEFLSRTETREQQAGETLALTF